MEKIGIMGGTFDPIHNGHLLAAEEVRQRLGLDKIIFVPAGVPPFKASVVSAGAKARYEMCLLATAGNPHFAVSDIEIAREGTSYAVDTVAGLKREYAAGRLFFIVGADVPAGFARWKDFGRILQLVEIVVTTRPGSCLDEWSDEYTGVEITGIDISSTAIREALAAGRPVRYMLPSVVADYIDKNGLYGGRIRLAKEKLALALSEPRFIHSVSVMEEAVSLGRFYKQNDDVVDGLRLAGLLHDCAKNICDEASFEELAEFCGSCGVELDEYFASCPTLAHSVVGALVARAEYGVSEPEVLSAIGCHTFGKRGMSFVDKAVYLADYIEPGRRRSEVRARARALAYENIDRAMIFVLRNEIERNTSRGRAVYDESLRALEYLEGENG